MDALEKNLTVFNKTKLKILKLLFDCDDYLCGCDLVTALGLPKNLISYHVAMLESLGLIEAARCGRNKNYRIKAPARDKTQKILEITELI